MNTIIFKVTGNRMTRVGGYDPVSGEKKYTEFRFEFDYEWNGVRSITVTMFFDVREPQNIVVDVENGVAVCNIEEELRNKSGILWVGVSGYDTVSGATLDCYLTALPVGEGTKVTEVATTLLYQQIVELVGRIETKLPVSTLYIQDLAVTTAKLADGAVTGEKVKENTLTPDKFDREYWEHLNRSTINTYADLDNIIATDTKLNTAFTVMFTGLSPIKSVVGEGTFFVLKSNTSESLLLINVDNGEMWSYTQGANEVTRASVTKEDLAVTTEKLADGAVTGEKVKENTLTPDKFDREYWEKKVYTKVIDSYTGLFSSIVPINSGGSICIANLNIITGAGRLSGYCEIVAVLEDTGTGMYITDLGDGSCWRIFKEKDKEVFSAFHNEDIRYLAKSSTNLGEVISDFDTLFQKVGYISMSGTVGFVKILVSGKDKVTVIGNNGVLDGEFMAVGSPTFTGKTIYLRNLMSGECWTVVHNGDGSYLATKIDALTPRVEHLEKYSVINLGAIANKESLKNVSFNEDNLYRFSFTGELKNQIELLANDCLGSYGFENGPGRYLKFINLENGKSGVYWIDLGSYVENSVSSGSGIYIGSGEMPEDCDIQIDPDGEGVDPSELVTKEHLESELAKVGGGESALPETASAGQVLRVAETDEEGNIISFEAVDREEFLLDGWRTITNISIDEETTNVVVTQDDEGNPFELSELRVYAQVKTVDNLNAGFSCAARADAEEKDKEWGYPISSSAATIKSSDSYHARIMCHIYKINLGRWAVESAYASSSTPQQRQPVYIAPMKYPGGSYFTFLTEDVDMIRQIKLWGTFAAGSEIEIIGR